MAGARNTHFTTSVESEGNAPHEFSAIWLLRSTYYFTLIKAQMTIEFIFIQFVAFSSEKLENTNVSFFDNDTLSFNPVRKIIFEKELSVGDPYRDIVTVTNIPLLVSIIKLF